VVIGVRHLEFRLKWRVFYRFWVRIGEILGRFGGLHQVLDAPVQTVGAPARLGHHTFVSGHKIDVFEVEQTQFGAPIVFMRKTTLRSQTQS